VPPEAATIVEVAEITEGWALAVAAKSAQCGAAAAESLMQKP
jgi:hypothetical protein